MRTGVESTHRIAELTLGALKKTGLPATPRNFELWYAHVAGRHPALSRDIQSATDAFGKVSQDNADAIYRNHLQQAELSRGVLDIVTRFNAEITDLYTIIEKGEANAAGHVETLSELSEQVRQSAEKYPAVGVLLESVFAVTKDMRTQNELLEARLAESAREISTLQRSVENIEAEAMKDPLTGVSNRARFDKAIRFHVDETKATGEPLSLLMADIDHFKSFNDTWGHQTGDQVLRLVAEVLHGNIRNSDTLARYGGEEFAILLPGASLTNARALAERLRGAVEGRHLKKRRTDEDLGTITMSIGLAACREADTVESLIERADTCLYAAKDAGRNCVIDETALRASKQGAAKQGVAKRSAARSGAA